MRVERAFAFVDLAGFTAMTAREGDEEAVAVLSRFRHALREICARRAVRAAKWLGDGAMLVGVETRPVVETVLELQWLFGPGSRPGTSRHDAAATHPVTLSCGVTRGRVILYEGDDYIGHPVNLAARLCDLAGAGEVLAAADLVPSLPPWGAVRTSDQRRVRGLRDSVEVVGLALADAGPAALPDPVCGIPLTASSAVEIGRDTLGRRVWFCAASCRETWEARPDPGEGSPDEGAVREVFPF